MALPNFIIAGFPKCGSTSLHYYLEEHPEIFMPKQKELHYFTYNILSDMIAGPEDAEVNKFHINSFSEYQKCYKDVENEIAIGEASPSYINYESCIPSLKEKLGNNVKIIILLRDPIKRAYSNYLHLVREHREELNFDEAIKEEPNRVKARYSDFWYYTFNSFYYKKVKAYKDAFKNVLIITTEELNSNTKETVKKVYQFLEVDTEFSPNNIDRRYNSGGVYSDNFITRLMFKQNKFKVFIKKIMPITPWMKHLKHKIIGNFKKETPQINQESENYLVNLFKEDVNMLKKDFDVKTELWNSKFSEN